MPAWDLLAVTCEQFPQDVKLPHMGWNQLQRTERVPPIRGIAPEAISISRIPSLLPPEGRKRRRPATTGASSSLF